MTHSLSERFRMERKLGSKGAFGDVWLAKDTLLDRDVTIKCPKATRDPVRRERFLTEARLLARLNHSNITQIYDVIEEQDCFYLVIEYVDGMDLDEILAGGALSLDLVLEVAKGILDALAYAHERGIVHRDVKPSNVRIGDDVKLMDFGLAGLKSILERGTSTFAGTPAYMAPEQIEGRPMDGRADLYAFGVVLYEMIAGGRRPFECSTEGEMLDAHLQADPPPLTQFAPTVPPALEGVVMRLLAKDPEERYPSAEAVLEVLETVHVGPKVSNIPVSLTPFVGREAEMAAIAGHMQDPDCRLLTLVGPGGIGKTRLAQEAAMRQLDNYGHGVFLVSLAPLQSADAIVPTVAQALGFSFYEGVEPRQQLLDYLRQKSMLVVMDNYEHLLDGVDLVTDILKTAPDVRVLATSRERLNVQGEHLFPLAGMDVPEERDLRVVEPTASSAVRLFLHSARRVRPDFEPTEDDLGQVGRICRLVEGMPLGILLAGSLMEMLTPAEIAAEVEQGIDVLETDLRDTPARQRSIRALLDHSWILLTEREQAVLQALSVFRGGFTRRAAQAVTSATLRDLMALTHKSLLRRAGGRRYDLWHGLLWQYADEKLQASGQADAVRDAHSAYFTGALRQWGEDLKGARQPTALAEMDLEIETARAAWDRAVSQEQVERLHQAIDGLCRYYNSRAYLQDGETACRMTVNQLKMTASGEGLEVLAMALTWQGMFNRRSGRFDLAARLLQQALALAKQVDDRRTRARCQIEMAELCGKQGKFADASAWLERAYTDLKELDDQTGVGQVWHYGGTLAVQQGHLETARTLYRKSLNIWRKVGDRVNIASSLNNQGIIAQYQGDYETAQLLYEESLSISRELGNKWAIAVSLNNLGWLALHLGDYETARGQLEQAVALQREVGDRWHLTNSLINLGNAIRSQGDYDTARALYAEGLTISNDLGDRGAIAYLLEDIGCLAALQGQPERAMRLCGAAEKLRETIGAPLGPTEREDLDRRLSPVRQALGERAASRATAEGRTLSLQQAIAYSLQAG